MLSPNTILTHLKEWRRDMADPLTIGLISAGAGLFGSLMAGGQAQAPTVNAPPPPAAPARSPEGSPSTNKPAQAPSFLAAAAAPQQQNTASHTLLGQ
jgi:hypothetical protein